MALIRAIAVQPQNEALQLVVTRALTPDAYTEIGSVLSIAMVEPVLPA